jgi:hypothetical protein
VEKELGVTNEKAVEILDSLNGYMLVKTSEIEPDDETQTVYSFNPSFSFLPLL